MSRNELLDRFQTRLFIRNLILFVMQLENKIYNFYYY